MEFCELTMTVFVTGAVAVVSFRPRPKPEGLLLNVRFTVLGLTMTLVALSVPEESLAVSLISREDGYSWSGATNDPLEIPVKVWMSCV